MFTAASSDDGLEDDIATLSYERALRAHARYRTSGLPLPQSADLGSIGFEETLPALASSVSQSPVRLAASPEHAENLQSATDPESHRCRETPFERNLKSASITIRLSKTECAQLHRRAADAGLTVSAYLRSCTFEAESLRAMVKDTLAEVRLAKSQSRPPVSEPPSASGIRRLVEWLVRLLTLRHSGPRVARA